ncbi:LysR substrate-binding domain-containing protein [Nocardia abscessus]|uniref:LysR substrate-binding domain-containing protein n=1 Tax=Nocardia abscessus TaxID=120957 RepID=UPI002453F0C0|nr:LysR substrate-binding domain-containing protein [Nocardia abscessus]
MDFDLRTLRYFLALADERHFGRAAARVHIAQPALSQQIKQLETHLGIQLFDRSTRRVEITPAGERFTTHAQRIEAACARATDDMAAFARGSAGRVSVGFVGTATYDVLPRLTRMVRTELPDIDLRVRGELLSPQLLDGLATGEYDLALVRPQPSSEPGPQRGLHHLLAPSPDAPSIVLETLRTEQVLAVIPINHPLAQTDPVDLAALNGETFITHPSGDRSTMHHLVLDACARAGFRPPVLEVSETATLAVSVAAGLGVALAPEPVRSLGLDGVTYRHLQHPETVDLMLARRESEASPGVAAVAALVRAAAQAT